MNTDSFFSIGSTHQICQDYARSGSNYAIISDGCSSAIDSDFGCRLLVKSAEANIQELDTELFLRKTLEGMSNFSNEINLSEDSLCATLLVARVFDNKVQVIVVGDGAFVINSEEFYNIHFDSGAPYYLRYDLDENIKKEYFNKFPPTGRIEETIFGLNLNIEPFELKNDDLQSIAFRFEWEQDQINHITLFSDGINSFSELEQTATSKQPKPIEAAIVAQELTNYKNFAGEFVQRRCKRALKDYRNWTHYDDLSVASIKVT